MIVRQLGLQSYQKIWTAMKIFTESRLKNSVEDELWLVEHPAVFTQGQSGQSKHIINLHNIPLIQTDRGGQVTYHGPGQLIAYVLLDIQPLGFGVRGLVTRLEQAVVRLLSDYHIEAETTAESRGIYVQGAKICSIGLRIRKRFSYHGLALNVNMDLTPFSYIHPCGHDNIAITQLAHLVKDAPLARIKKQLSTHLMNNLSQ